MQHYVNCCAATGGDGSWEHPFRWISQAAQIAQPGDEVIVAPGIYREHVSPACGGTSEEKRIIYRSEVPLGAVITGAEVLTAWQHEDGNVWSCRVDNTVFQGDHPYTDPVQGDWYYFDAQRPVHRGSVYCNGRSLYEAFSLEALKKAEASDTSWEGERSRLQWYACVEEKTTAFYVNLQGEDPNAQCMEYSVRRHCFYPEKTGVNYITLSGFTVCQAASQWAPPTACQEGMIGPHWAKGWIIEDCHVFESKCVGISLGKYLQTENENKWSRKGWKHGTQTERDAICQAWNEGWCKENIGSHVVRRCHIHDCGQTGIAGHLGCVFSLIEDNHIHHINNTMELNGAEIGGIKLHAAIDTVIRHNHIHHCTRGLWLDWQAQGTRVTANTFHHNEPPAGVKIRNGLAFGEDIFIEVSHGPTLIDHNVMLSVNAARISTQGIAFAHNLIAGSFTCVGIGTNNAGVDCPESVRYMPYHVPHSTAVAGFMSILHGDARFYNNIFVQRTLRDEQRRYGHEAGRNMRCGLQPYDGYPTWEEYQRMFTPENVAGNRKIYYKHLPVWMQGNVYMNGAIPADTEADALRVCGKAELEICEGNGCCVLKTNLYDLLPDSANSLITTDVLGAAFEPEQRFEAPDGSDLKLDRDLAGCLHDQHPLSGPMAGKTAQILLSIAPCCKEAKSC